MRLMNGMFLYGKSVEVKFSEKTQLFIRDFYEIRKKELMNESKSCIISEIKGERAERQGDRRRADGHSHKRRRESNKQDEITHRNS